MKVLKWLAIIVLLAAVVVVGYGFSLPDQRQVERSIVIGSRPATVYTVLNGFRQFNAWSPWADLDPKTTYTLEGPPVGVGAKSSWSSEDPNVGAGSQEILEATPYSEIRIKLVFSGFDSDNLSIYRLAPEGEGTRVTWVYETDFKGSLIGRYFGLLLDKMIGADYEKGLAKLKTLVESLPQDDFSSATLQVLEVPARPIAHLPGEASASEAAPVLASLYGRLVAFAAASGRTMVDAPLAITHAYDEETQFWKFDAAIYLDAPCTPPAEGTGVLCGSSYAGWVVKAQHKGSYASSGSTYAQLITYKTVAGLQDNGDSWEHYVVDPATVPESEILTDLYWPVK